MRGGIELADFLQKLIPLRTWLQLYYLTFKALLFVRNAVSEEMKSGFATLHGVAPLLKKGGSATGVLITDRCHN
jgi:hypothetical protein